MKDYEIREVQLEALPVYFRLLTTERHLERALDEEVVSAETAIVLETLADACMVPLGVGIEDREGDDPAWRLKITLEGVRKAIKRLRNILERNPGDSDGETESVMEGLKTLRDTFLNETWLSEQELTEEPVTLKGWGMMFTRDGELVGDIASTVERKVEKVKELQEHLDATVPVYIGALRNLKAALMSEENSEVLSSVVKESLAAIPTTPAAGLGDKDCQLLGYPKGETFVKEDELVEWAFNWNNSAPEYSGELPVPSRDDIVRLAGYSAEFLAIFEVLRKAIKSNEYAGTWEQLPDSARALEGTAPDAWAELSKILTTQHASAVACDGYRLLSTFCRRMAQGIQAYLAATLKQKNEEEED